MGADYKNIPRLVCSSREECAGANPKTKAIICMPMLLEAAKMENLQEKAEVPFRAVTRQQPLSISRRVIKTETLEMNSSGSR